MAFLAAPPIVWGGNAPQAMAVLIASLLPTRPPVLNQPLIVAPAAAGLANEPAVGYATAG